MTENGSERNPTGPGQDDRGRPPDGRLRRPVEREPALNLPSIISALALILVAVHLVRTLLLSAEMDRWVVIAFAFIPARYGELAGELPFQAAAIWSPVSYAFLHGDWTHLFVNLFWLAAFGSPVGRRLGWWRTLVIGLLGSSAGAAAHYMAFAGELVPMVGASAIVAAFMGAAARFAFAPGAGARLNVEGPAQSLLQSFSNPRFLIFLTVWLGLNYLFGTGVVPIAGEGVRIAWQAHIGGFLAGLAAFSALDRVRR